MSFSVPNRPRSAVRRQRLAIVASEYNGNFVQGLIEATTTEVAQLNPAVTMDIFRVPGAFEIPYFAQEVAERGGSDGIIALGVIIQGQTEHARLIAESVTRSLLEISLRYRLPLIHEVLLVANEEQARERCLGTGINRGTEAARAAIQLLHAAHEFKTH